MYRTPPSTTRPIQSNPASEEDFLSPADFPEHQQLPQTSSPAQHRLTQRRLSPQFSPQLGNEQQDSGEPGELEQSSSQLPGEQRVLETPRASPPHSAQQQQDNMALNDQAGPEVNAIHNCRLPPFWKSHPALWFTQVEAAFQLHRVTSEAQKYNLIIAALDPEALQEVTDIVRGPQEQRQYTVLKDAILQRLEESADRSIRRLLAECELGGKRPSRLLRDMRELAGDRVSEDVLRIRWMDCLPTSTQRLLRVFRPPISLDDLATAADELVETVAPTVAFSNVASTSRARSPGIPRDARTTAIDTAAELTSIRTVLAQLTATVRELLDGRHQVHPENHRRGRSRTRERTTDRARSPSTSTSGLCFYHFRFGAAARRCQTPCNFNARQQQLDDTIAPASVMATDAGLTTQTDNRLLLHDRETRLKFLVDSGSVVSLLPATSAGRKGQQRKKLTLYAANASAIATFGERTLTLNLGLRRQLRWTFIVADVQTAILGADFLAHFGLLVDVKRRRLVDPLTALAVEGKFCIASVHTVSTARSLNAPSGEYSQQYSRLLNEFAALASPCTSAALLEGSAVQHHIVTVGPPVAERHRRLTGDRLAIAKQEFNTLLQQGIIRPSASPWSSPLHLVPKADGGWRATGDYRRLNAATTPDRYPLPVIEDLLQDCHGCTVFSKIDLQKAYYQIPVAAEDVQKTAITTPFGLYEFIGMPFGLRNASQTFQRFMDSLIRQLPFVRCYVDDLLVVSRSHEEHLQHLRQLFETLRQARLSINLGKSLFGQSSVTYLGYLVSKDGYQPPPNRVKAIEEFPRPVNVSQLRRFLGILNYYRRCIPSAASTQAPLHGLLQGLPKRSKAALRWTPDAIQAFADSKKSIVEAVTPAFLSHSAPLTLITDASNQQIGAALEQLDNGTWRPVGFFSRKLSETEMRYSTYDRELLAVYAAIKFFQRILEGRQFMIKTDHRPLIYAEQQSSDRASPRQQRQLDFILQFNAKFVHIKGEDNVVADALSRTCAVSMPTGLDPETLSTAQQSCEQLQHLLQDTTTATKLHRLIIEGHPVYCDIATGTVKPYVPVTLRRAAFNIVHGPAHPSRRATTRLLLQKFFWPRMRKDSAEWARTCEPCQRAKVSRHNRAALGNFNAPDNRFDHVHVDLITLPMVRNLKYCLTIIDRFSRWPAAIPLADMQAETVAKAFFEQWICLYGPPLTISSDQGTQFESALFEALAKLVGATRTRTTPYHPQANGMVERFHRTLKAALMCSPQTPWPDLLPAVLLGLRTAYKEDLQASPAEMLYGVSLRLPGEFFVTSSIPASPRDFVGSLRQLFRDIKAVPASRHVKQHPFIFKDLHSCTHVFKRVDSIRKPLEPPYTGPHEVVRRLDDRTFVINVNGKEKTYSTDALKPAYMEVTEPMQDQNDTLPPLAGSGPPPAPAQQPTSKRVSFLSSSPDDVTGQGVDVAVETPQATSASAQQSRRKQTLIPRPLF